MTRIAEEPRARAISNHNECIVGYLFCHHRSPARFDFQKRGRTSASRSLQLL